MCVINDFFQRSRNSKRTYKFVFRKNLQNQIQWETCPHIRAWIQRRASETNMKPFGSWPWYRWVRRGIPTNPSPPSVFLTFLEGIITKPCPIGDRPKEISTIITTMWGALWDRGTPGIVRGGTASAPPMRRKSMWRTTSRPCPSYRTTPPWTLSWRWPTKPSKV